MKTLNLIAKSGFWILLGLTMQNARANNFSIGLNYNNGGVTGAPIFGYGANYGSVGAIANCLPPWAYGQGSVISGYIPPTTTLPRIQTPMRNQIGFPGGGGYAHYPQPYPVPVPVPYPVPVGGGYGRGGGHHGHSFTDIYGYGSDVVDTRLTFSWHKSDIPDIVGNMAGGLAAMQTGVYPVNFYNRPRFDVGPFSTGSRGYEFNERDLEYHY